MATYILPPQQTGSRYLRTGGLSSGTVRLAALSLWSGPPMISTILVVWLFAPCLVLGQAHSCLQIFDHLLALLLE